MAPMAIPIHGGYDCGDPHCRVLGPHPLARWRELATVHVAHVDRIWSTTPWGIALVTGHRFDVLEVPAHIGSPTHHHIGARCPTAITPDKKWLFVITPGSVLPAALNGCRDVTLHGKDSWAPASPTPYLRNRVYWMSPPTATQWRPGDATEVFEAAVQAHTGRLHLTV